MIITIRSSHLFMKSIVVLKEASIKLNQEMGELMDSEQWAFYFINKRDLEQNSQLQDGFLKLGNTIT